MPPYSLSLANHGCRHGGHACRRSLYEMFDAIWLVLTLGLFGIGLAYLAACDRV
jgi:hypothetical protein